MTCVISGKLYIGTCLFRHNLLLAVIIIAIVVVFAVVAATISVVVYVFMQHKKRYTLFLFLNDIPSDQPGGEPKN